MPKLWAETIESHRREVGDAILDTASRLVTQLGVRAVTMSQIAEEVGIGRATLYKYFPDVETILVAWHEKQVSSHLEHLLEVRDLVGDPEQRLQAVLEAYARLSFGTRGGHDADLAALLHGDEHVRAAHERVHVMIREVLADAVKTGSVRRDIPIPELASYCVHALEAASTQRSQAALRRIVAVISRGLRPD